jgi:hypothetical protein
VWRVGTLNNTLAHRLLLFGAGPSGVESSHGRKEEQQAERKGTLSPSFSCDRHAELTRSACQADKEKEKQMALQQQQQQQQQQQTPAQQQQQQLAQQQQQQLAQAAASLNFRKQDVSNLRKEDVRILQRKLCYVVGLPASVAREEVLKKKEYFG